MVDGYQAHSLAEALHLLSQKKLLPYAGGTDLMPQGQAQAPYLFIGQLPELKQIVDDGQFIHIGSAVTFSEALASPLVPPLMKEAVSGIGAPAVRNAGTFGGNIANGSAKGDSLLIDFVADAKVRIAAARGERLAPIAEVFIERKRVALAHDELIMEILLPNRGLENYYYQKVGGQSALAIARVSCAAVIDTTDQCISRLAIAFGALSDRIQRFRDLEELLVGCPLSEARAHKKDFLSAYQKRLEISPDRTSIDYRRTVAMRLLADFFSQKGI